MASLFNGEVALVTGGASRIGRGTALETTETEWGELELFLKIFAVNATGGAIVNTASVAGMAGLGGAGYCGSKHAVIGLCSKRASFTTGHPLAVDGGALAR